MVDMLDIRFIRENKDLVAMAAKNKHREFDIDKLLELDNKRRSVMKNVEEKRAEQNLASVEIVKALGPEKANILEKMRFLKEELGREEENLKEVTEEWMSIMVKIPNIYSADTPVGEDENENKIIRQWGEKPNFDFTPKEHDLLGEELDIIDLTTASEVAGSRFAYIKGDLALLQFALIQFVLGILTDEEILGNIANDAKLSINTKSFVPVIPPVFIKPAVQNRMARFMTPEEHYMFPNDDLMLIGSAEHALGPIYMDKIIPEEKLPIRFIGYSTAFRREAGSHGKDTKGIIRQHQFDKLEMESFTLPENSIQEQEFFVAIQEYILKSLELPYQVVMVCTGDMGFPDYRQIDIETWMPGQGKYRETHSADLTGNFQSRRLNARVKRNNNIIEPVHMNDATAVAIGRMLVAILENFQQADGSVKIPDVLVPYMNGKTVIQNNKPE